jgi:hypothetical protein
VTSVTHCDPPPCSRLEFVSLSGQYAAHTGNPIHGRDHFIEVYCDSILAQLSTAAGVPTPEQTWKDVKNHVGLRGELQAVFAAASHISRGIATAASLERTEQQERIARGARGVSED